MTCISVFNVGSMAGLQRSFHVLRLFSVIEMFTVRAERRKDSPDMDFSATCSAVGLRTIIKQSVRQRSVGEGEGYSRPRDSFFRSVAKQERSSWASRGGLSAKRPRVLLPAVRLAQHATGPRSTPKGSNDTASKPGNLASLLVKSHFLLLA